MKSALFFILIFIGIGSYAQEASFEPGELLVQFHNGSNQNEFLRNFETETEILVKEFKCLSEIANIYLIKFRNSNENLDQAKRLIYTYKEVNLVQKNHHITVRETIPTDTLFANQWFHKNTGQTGGTTDADIDTPDAWDITSGGVTTHDDTIVVCIIEGSGVDINHVDLVDNIWHNYGEIPNNGIDDDNNGYIDDFDGWNVQTLDDAVGSGSHGTRVAGMIGATGNNVTGISGVNWDVKMMIIKGQQASNEATVIAAYNYPLVMRKLYNDSYGQQGAFVVATNASWGIDNGDPADAPLWCAMYDTLGMYGILNVAATTNSNSNIDAVGDLPTTCPSDYLISVTMTDDDDLRANSGYGPIHVDLGAPGSGVLLTNTTLPYSSTNGTSFASPCVAGSVALAYSSPCPDFINFVKYDPAAGALQMKNYIFSSVDIIPNLTGEVATNGRLNIKNAIDSILANCNISACNSPYSVHDALITDTTATLQWGGFSTDYLFYIQEGSGPEVEIPLTNQDTIFIDTLIPCTQYTVRVRGVCGSDTSDYSYPFNFTTDGCCKNPPLGLVDAGQDSIVIEWNPVLYASSYDIRYRKQGDITWIATLVDTISPLNLTGLDTCTNYEVQIKTTCTDSTQGYSSSYVFSTLGCGSCYESVYCDVVGANDNLEWIDSIVINWAMSVTGPNNGWYQSTAVLTSFEPGSTYPVVLAPGYSGATFTERFSIWIDLDQNGVFDFTDKLLSNVSTTSVINDNITIPSSAFYGITKMRIGMNGVSNPEECPNGSFFGEYEDYCVYIGEDANVDELENEFAIYPNPTNGMLNISSSLNIIQAVIYSYDGKLVYSESGILNQIDVSTLSPGMYVLQLQTDQGAETLKFIKQ